MRGDANGANGANGAKGADGDDRAAAAEPDEIGSMRRVAAGVAILSAAILLAEVTLSRVFAIVQFHHFAFLLVTLALLGFGASGSLLAVFTRLSSPRLWPAYALGFALTSTAGYLLVVRFPFDSYRIAWDPREVWLLAANLLALAFPFALAGLLIGGMLRRSPAQAGQIYGANLIGSALGAFGAPFAIVTLGAEHAIPVAAALGAAAAVALAGRRRSVAIAGGILAAVLVALPVVAPGAVEPQPSPYKRLSQLRLDPDNRVLATRQDAAARLDIVESSTIHSAPGLSVSYLGDLPPQVGLVLDGDALLPVPQADAFAPDLGRSVPAALAHRIRPEANTLLLGSGGGFPALAALANGATSVTVVEPSRLVLDALTADLREWAGLADDPRVTLIHDEVRSFAASAKGDAAYDVIELSLTDAYRPVTSGAYSLTETYVLTTDAFAAYLDLLGDDGILVVTRWLQTPPSEELRTLAMIASALGDGSSPLNDHVFVSRTFQTATFLVKRAPFTTTETDALIAELERLRYDLVLAQRMPEELVNRFAVTQQPHFHEQAVELATSSDRDALYARSEFDITPPTDDRPFFFHFFRWDQTPEVLENIGRRWQPFGGSGYFVLLALLAFAVMAAFAFVLAPIALARRFRSSLGEVGARRAVPILAYFTALGLAFLLVEIALVQRAILVLGQPALALATVIGGVLLASGLGSIASSRLPWRVSLVAVVTLAVLGAITSGPLAHALLGQPLPVRLIGVTALIGPLAFFMGVPFARGIAALSAHPAMVPWAWAANGSASVIAGVLAVLLSLSFGLGAVLWIGAGFYAVALLTTPRG
jgi:spermidine synthase